jgi:threonine aldolase
MSYQGWSDFRSDTVTRPTAEMRKAMAEAEVGDDVLGDDPTVIRLQELAAELTGKEAGLFIPSGTMGNTIALMVHGCRAKEVMVEEKCHIYNFECGNMSHLAGAVPRPLPSDRGMIALADLESNFKGIGAAHMAPTAGICLENSHNYHGGAVMPMEYMEAVAAFARSRHLFLHLDGARIFNAAAFLKVDVRRIAQPFDSVMFCLSKGLAAPVGSMLVGSRGFIDEAHSVRKQLGGGMRQVGILAAAGMIALQKMRLRLEDDHRRARRLADAIAEMPGLSIRPSDVQSNIVIFTVRSNAIDSNSLIRRMKEDRVLSLPFGTGRVRMVVHNDIDDADIERAITCLKKTMPA